MTRQFRRCVPLLLIQIALVAAALSAPARADTTLYVAPDGNDAWTGSLPAPSAQRTDGPLATPVHARDAARAAHAKDPAHPVTISLRGGTYFLDEPLALGPQDSGSAQAQIVWSAFPNESPVLSAGRPISGWQKVQVNGHEAWAAKLPPVLQNAPPFRELWVNGKRAQRSRWPKHGTLAVANMPAPKGHEEWRQKASEFPFTPNDLKAWASVGDADAVLTSKWVEARLPVAAVDEQNHHVRSNLQAGFRPETGDRYYLENVKEALEEPGEWYLDPHEKMLYLIPPAGVAMGDVQVVAPLLPQVVRLAGDPANGHFLEYVAFQNIGFSHSEWYYDRPAPNEKPEPGRTDFNQAAIGVAGAVWGEGVRSCTFSHCTIAHVGNYGIQLARGCQHNRVAQCTVTDLGAGGVKIGETVIRDGENDQAFGNEVSDCRITDGGNVFTSAVGVWIGQSHDNTLAHNEIARFWYTGVSVGWTWGYGKALSQGNVIEYNDIHHIGIKADDDKPVLSDMGGIYTLGNEKGTVIRNNRFHDVAGLHYGGWGIYFDEGTTDILAESNLVYRTTHGGFHQHYGKDNVVRNNIFALGRDAQIQRTRIENHRSFTFEQNIVYWDKGNLLAGDWNKLNVAFDHNTYWHAAKGEIKFAHYTWEQWRAQGMDEHSQIADPHFENPQGGDFRIKSGEEKKLAGFVPFDYAAVGPRAEK
ncbi:MAG TPA: right-handed parallel beta-helix repeat-containing protein [Tepidisphaeraceae bacterium]|nr:right-handed parallel beta-helix repeat-containing protein [Tepidisphaeraceae bacterium]